MTTAADALDAIRSRIEAAGLSVPLYWHGDDPPILPDTPTTFVYFVFNNSGSGGSPVAYGGGRGANIYRNRATLEAYVFSPPTGAVGMGPVMDTAETVAAALRSFRDADISVFSADVVPVGPGSNLSPPGLSSEVNNYLCAIAEIELTFDQIG
jgi:hypothetical protein